MTFTSDLSTGDFWLLVDVGYKPISVVMGNSVYSMGMVGGFASGLKGMTKGEIPQLTELMYNAREMALGRMKAEAEKLGADGVIGVKLSIEYMKGGEWMEITAIGTAVKYEGKQNSGGKGPTIVLPLTGSKEKSNV